MVEIGSTVYWYTFRKRKMYVHEGTVIEYSKRMNLVQFKDKTPRHRCPRKNDFGILQVNRSASLWLLERNDEYAQKIFKNYTEERIAKLTQEIEEHLLQIKYLKERL